jgi:hypothetical protein
MFGSEVLDAAAIGAGAALLGGIIAGIFSYLTNRANISAERSKITFERQLDAFSRITELIGEIENERLQTHNSYVRMKVDNESDKLEPEQEDYLLQQMQSIQEKVLKLRTIHTQNVIYLTSNISQEVEIYIQNIVWDKPIIVSYIHEYDSKVCANRTGTKIVRKMSDFIGVKQRRRVNTGYSSSEDLDLPPFLRHRRH